MLTRHMELQTDILQSVPEHRRSILDAIADYVDSKTAVGKIAKLQFICTHNSRRSQLAQVWAQYFANRYSVQVDCYSGGTEETAFNGNAVAALRKAGFRIDKEGESNPRYTVWLDDDQNPLIAYSKTFDSPENPGKNFCAVMTCSDADRNCPFIPGAEKRVSLTYEDPKEFDNTEFTEEKYNERSIQIASEMNYLFQKVAS